MKTKHKKRLASIIVGCVTIMLLILLDKLEVIQIEDYIYLEKENIAIANNEIEDLNCYKVVRVVDGDTFVIEYNENHEKVRLIGVDTPESVHPDQNKNTEYGNEVSNFSKEMLTGKEVVLEFDVEKRDKYGRLLAYVYLNGQMYNKLLLEKGYAQVSTYPPNVKYVEDFTAIQKQAIINKQGMWAY